MIAGRPPLITEGDAREIFARAARARGPRGVMPWGALRDLAAETGLTVRYLRHLLSSPPKRFESLQR